MSVTLHVSKQSAWDAQQIERYLDQQRTPMRLAVLDHDDFPMICSVWHQYHQQKIYAVTHKNSKLAKKLQQTPQCAFEIAPNEPPYKGVRGQAVASLTALSAEATLERLCHRFLGDGYENLREFLSQRSEDERLIELNITSLTSWDFSERMTH